MKSFAKIFAIAFLCAACAGWLRMFYPLSTWYSWSSLKDKAFIVLIKALFVTCLSELIYFFPFYIIAVLSYVFIANRLMKKWNNGYMYVGLGLICGLLSFALFAWVLNFLWREESEFLFLVYGATGALFGVLYYLIVRKDKLIRLDNLREIG
jgi:hypothetical protein